MTFTYERGGRLDDILIEAIRHARTHREDAVFVFNDVNVIVSERSNLPYIWTGYFGTPKGRTVGPCEFGLSNLVSLPRGFEIWEAWQMREAFRIIARLLAASR